MEAVSLHGLSQTLLEPRAESWRPAPARAAGPNPARTTMMFRNIHQ
jgi:hypothetical protein